MNVRPDRLDRLDEAIDRAAGMLLTPRGDGHALASRVAEALPPRPVPAWWSRPLPLWQTAVVVVSMAVAGAYLSGPAPLPRIPARPDIAVPAPLVTGPIPNAPAFDAGSSTIATRRPPAVHDGPVEEREPEWGLASLTELAPLDLGVLDVAPIDLTGLGSEIVPALTLPELTLGLLTLSESRE